MSGHLCLKWNNHSSAFDKLLNNLHLKEMYSDATLVCQGKFYPVHRFVLTTCSDYFEEIFNRCVKLNNKHPFIIVKDINPIQMEALLNYMYRGEVNVPQEQLPELIKAAEAFKIKGLAVPDEDPLPRLSKKRANASSPIPQSKKSRKYEDRNKSSDNNINEITSEIPVVDSDHSDSHSDNKGLQSSSKDTSPSQNIGTENDYITDSLSTTQVKTEPIDDIDQMGQDDTGNKSESSVKDEQLYDTYSEPYPPYNEDDPGINDNFDVAQSSTWENSQDFEGNSIEGDHTQRMQPSGIFDELQCPFCSYKCAWRSTMDKHERKHTGEKPFQCTHCPYRSSQNCNLQSHILKKHATFSCSFCSFEANSALTLVEHETTHATNLPTI